jgi:transketolase
MSTTFAGLGIGPRADRAELFALAQQLRADSIRASTAAGAGHPSSSMSAADLMAVLLTGHLRYDWDEPGNPRNDHLVFSKGHASPLLYAMYKAAGVISDDELMTTYRRGGRLQGHPTPVLPWVDVATGSLGQGIGYAVGIALAGRRLERAPYRVWTLCGDSEMAEGSVWEALDKASHYELGNFTAIVDVNRLGQVGPTGLGWDTERYARRVEAFGCRALIIDGHDLEQIAVAFETVREGEQPTVVIARTVKGRGFPEVEDQPGWHGKPLPPDMAERAVRELGGVTSLRARGPLPGDQPPAEDRPTDDTPLVEPPRFELGAAVATRAAFGQALTALGARLDVVVLDGEVGNSTCAEKFQERYPNRYFQMYIAEQQLLASAVGLAVRGYRPFAATFAAFLTRAHDFLRIAAVSGVDLCIVGSHCGVEIGSDGPSQMGLEDLAMLRAVHGSTVLYPADATSAAALTLAMADLEGISYLRTTRGAYPVLYGPDESFPVGGSKVWHEGPEDAVTLVAAGVTLHESLAAAKDLAARGIPTRVIDLYSVKPLDAATLRRAAAETRLVVAVEDHHPEGGIGEAVAAVLAETPGGARFAHLAVRTLPGSTTTAEALDAAGINAEHITATVADSVD